MKKKTNSQNILVWQRLEQENGKAEHKAHICCRILYPESKEQLHIGLTGNLIVYNGQKSKFWKIQCLNTWKEAENY